MSHSPYRPIDLATVDKQIATRSFGNLVTAVLPEKIIVPNRRFPARQSTFSDAEGRLAVRVFSPRALSSLPVAAPPATDPFFSSVVLLMHFDGPNGGTVFTDSTGRHTVGTGSGVVNSSTQFKFGGASGYFPASVGAYGSIANSSDFDFGSGDFCVEFWLWPRTNTGGVQGLWFNVTSVSGRGFVFVANTANLQLILYDNAVSLVANITATSALTGATWHHIAATRSGSAVTIWVNGSSAATTTVGGSGVIQPNTTSSSNIGVDPGTLSRLYDGYMDDLRITKGVARYTSAFTPPTAAFPNS